MGTLADSFGRRFHYLRLSVTDACNFRCVYCLPNGYEKPKGQSEPLRLAEIRNLISAFVEMGLWKVRLTGGEPTLRRDILEIAAAVAAVPGVRKLALSTNGYRLASLASPLRRAGVSALNVSVDSPDAANFARITGTDRLKDVLAGIDAAFAAGFETVKVNAVLLKGMNDGDVDGFLEWAKRAPVSVRFIELMRTGDNRELFERSHVSAGEIRFRLLRAGWRQRERAEGDGPAVEFTHADYRGSVGLIAPYSKDFCKSCNRLRVSSQGALRLCLFGEGDRPLRHLLQDESQRDELIHEVRAAMGWKRVSHFLHEGNHGTTRHLAAIGG